ncbi:MAG: phosphate acyltransferase PlsX [Psychromonas sp.]|nr:phosphate acyltransferase PlsX [Psychromonas sp.]
MKKFIIALDAMGGDLGPHVSIKAAKNILTKYPDLYLIVVGDNKKLLNLVKCYHLEQHPRLTLMNADTFIKMQDDPIHVIRHAKDTSMQVVLDLVKNGKADACVSAGNTGALMLLAKKTLKMVDGLTRPALVSAMPNSQSGSVYLLDLGANLQCDSAILFNFAIMGSALCGAVEQISSPRVALLNIGKENKKGNDKLTHSAQLLTDANCINYIGFIEADELFSNKADVVVTDGFSGNIALKSYEGMERVFHGELHKAFNQNFYSKILGKLIKPILKKQFKHLQPDRYNGASLIGLRGIVIKSHGSSNEVAFSYAIEQAIKEIQWQIPMYISKTLESALF